jgi:hypothetical protein
MINDLEISRFRRRLPSRAPLLNPGYAGIFVVGSRRAGIPMTFSSMY